MFQLWHEKDGCDLEEPFLPFSLCHSHRVYYEERCVCFTDVLFHSPTLWYLAQRCNESHRMETCLEDICQRNEKCTESGFNVQIHVYLSNKKGRIKPPSDRLLISFVLRRRIGLNVGVRVNSVFPGKTFNSCACNFQILTDRDSNKTDFWDLRRI